MTQHAQTTTVTHKNRIQTLQLQQKEDKNKIWNLLFKHRSPHFSFG